MTTGPLLPAMNFNPNMVAALYENVRGVLIRAVLQELFKRVRAQIAPKIVWLEYNLVAHFVSFPICFDADCPGFEAGA